jgi:TolB-like protein/Tfp pilus assembly protein PilF
MSVSHYDVGELLGTGGMGEVYRAADQRLGRRVALKFLRPFADAGMRQRFLREAQAAALLDHPNICTVFDVDQTDAGDVFIAMACYEGETVDRILARGPMPLARALSIAVQAGRGLAAAHEDLIVHRDVKPANLMVARSDVVKILDFGVARLLGDARAPDGRTVFGTPAYMSPEQLADEPVDQRADIWGLGVTLYEMVTGRVPFRADDRGDLVDAIRRAAPVRASRMVAGVPPRLDQILDTALAKSPRLRYERMDAMVRELLEVQGALDSGAVTVRQPVAARRSSIAVLPFEDMSAAKDQQFLCDGIAEEILRGLNRIPELYVASRTSAFQFKHQAADIRDVGARLNVDTVLEGSVRRVGDRLRVSAQLISVSDGYRIWSDRYDRDMEDIFALQDEIAEQIAQALQVTLARRAEPNERPRSAAGAEAYELYLQGRQFFHQHRRKAFETAIQTFAAAIAIDPAFARAYAGMADCHSFLCLYFGKGAPAIEAANAASETAIRLNPQLSDAHVSRGLALFLKRDYEAAERHLRRALELDPRLYDAHYIFGRMCFSRGQIAEAADRFREACALVPEAYDAWYLLGMCYRRLGEAARGKRADFACMEAVQKAVRSHPDDTRAWTMGASVLAEMGEPDRSAEWLARALAIDPDEAIIQYNATCVYVALQRHDDALRSLGAAIALGGIATKDWATNDPDLDPLRADPRFQALLAAMPV